MPSPTVTKTYTSTMAPLPFMRESDTDTDKDSCSSAQEAPSAIRSPTAKATAPAPGTGCTGPARPSHENCWMTLVRFELNMPETCLDSLHNTVALHFDDADLHSRHDFMEKVRLMGHAIAAANEMPTDKFEEHSFVNYHNICLVWYKRGKMCGSTELESLEDIEFYDTLQCAKAFDIYCEADLVIKQVC